MSRVQGKHKTKIISYLLRQDAASVYNVFSKILIVRSLIQAKKVDSCYAMGPQDLFEKHDGEWMIREEFEEPSDKEIMDAWLGRPSKRFSMWMERKKRYDDSNKLLSVASKNRRDSSEQSSQDCGYSSEHNISSSSLPSTPEGSELACSESCCNQDEGDCHDSNYNHKLVHSNSNLFLFREQPSGQASHGLTLTQMLEVDKKQDKNLQKKLKHRILFVSRFFEIFILSFFFF